MRFPALDDNGETLFGWMEYLFPINRSLTGNGNRETLKFLQTLLPKLEIHEVKSGTKVGDWVVPDEWNPKQAYIENTDGNRIADFASLNLHLMGYSAPVDRWVSKSELEEHIYSIPHEPTAVPYVTSYYRRDWGFCLSENSRKEIGDGPFKVFIDASIESGSMSYADIVIKGNSSEEVLFSTYFCHPSMANNELSGPAIAVALARWVEQIPNRHYTYRFVFVPETIGSIAYIAKHGAYLNRKVRAAWQLTCLGDDQSLSFLPSKSGNTLSDRVSRVILKMQKQQFVEYSFLERGSDERQYCWPSIELPMCSIMRSKYQTYAEYHTSLDDMNFVTPMGLSTSFSILRDCIKLLELNDVFESTTIGEPNLGSRGLYELTNKWQKQPGVPNLLNLLMYSDGKSDLVEIMHLTNIGVDEIIDLVDISIKHGLLAKRKPKMGRFIQGKQRKGQ